MRQLPSFALPIAAVLLTHGCASSGDETAIRRGPASLAAPQAASGTGQAARRDLAKDQRSVVETPQRITISIGTKMTLIPAGSFLMGATPTDPHPVNDEAPQREVSIRVPFYLAIYELTQLEYRQVTGSNPSMFTDSESLPVERVTWFDAVRFCNQLSEREQRLPYYKIEGNNVTILGGNGYRLPTEAEWEYACRAPESALTATKHPFGDNDEDLGRYAWFGQNSEWKTHPVGQKLPNRWGLYDMQGNVWEWCQDWYSINSPSSAPESNPQGPAQTSDRVSRGGGWNFGPRDCRPESRINDEPGSRFNNLGFRLARDR